MHFSFEYLRVLFIISFVIMSSKKKKPDNDSQQKNIMAYFSPKKATRPSKDKKPPSFEPLDSSDLRYDLMPHIYEYCPYSNEIKVRLEAKKKAKKLTSTRRRSSPIQRERTHFLLGTEIVLQILVDLCYGRFYWRLCGSPLSPLQPQLTAKNVTKRLSSSPAGEDDNLFVTFFAVNSTSS
jgi:hypothetical protein